MVRIRASYTPPDLTGIKINLSTNESPYDLPLKIKRQIFQKAEKINFNRYPDPTCRILIEKLSKKLNVPEEKLVIGNGSDEILLYIFLALGHKKKVLIFEPSFEMYTILAQLAECEIVKTPLSPDWQPVKIPSNFDIAVIGYPNNPTANCFDNTFIEKLIETGKIIVIDEAYHEFAQKTFLEHAKTHKNVIVTRTFSKAWRLASLRVGYAVADSSIVNLIKSVKLPFNVNSFSMLAASTILDFQDEIEKCVKIIIKEREVLSEKLKEMGFIVYPSKANFLWTEHPDSPKIWEELKKQGILVRRFSSYPNFLRITVGKPAENKALLDKLKGL